MNNDGKEFELARLLWTCECLQEIHDLATMFNYSYKVAVDHFERLEELKVGVDELVVKNGL